MRNRLIIANVLNVIDIIFTLFMVEHSIGLELNPLWSHVISIDIGWFCFILAKLVLMALITLWIYVRNKNKETAFGRVASYIVCYGMAVVNIANVIALMHAVSMLIEGLAL